MIQPEIDRVGQINTSEAKKKRRLKEDPKSSTCIMATVYCSSQNIKRYHQMLLAKYANSKSQNIRRTLRESVALFLAIRSQFSLTC